VRAATGAGGGATIGEGRSGSGSGSGSSSGVLANSGALAKRYIPAAVRRAVEARDGQRCAYVDEGGRRCPETHRLEFHHVVAFALGGAHSLDNVSLRCRCHNLLAAEDDFGREVMQRARGRRAHESLARQVACARSERGAAAWGVVQD
jgi:hypothetical protein